MKKILLGLAILSSIAMGEVTGYQEMEYHDYYMSTKNTLEKDEGLYSEKVRAMRQCTAYISELKGYTEEDSLRGIGYILSDASSYIDEDGNIVRSFFINISENK